MTPAATMALCGLLAGAAVVCLWPPRPTPERRTSSRAIWALPLVVAGAVLGWRVADRPEVVALLMIALGAAFAATRLVARHRAGRAAARERALVIELCDALQAELASGQTPITALQRAAGSWPLLASATRTAIAGGDVPTVLRELAGRPGAGDLRIVAAAWQIAHRTGHGLGDAVARVGSELRAAESTGRVVAGELASARATARLVAALPLAALLMGSGAGADPWSFLVGQPLGLACLAGGLACGLLGLAWIEALARDVERGR